ncbi:MAG TPA: alpha/beta hydrolase [Aliidongia sp.]|nr:alpha/beta hydrolase [Aliidongia sp.]
MRFRIIVAALLLIRPVEAVRAETTQIPGLIRAPLELRFAPEGGSEITLEGTVTRPDRPGRFPLALINHGSPRKREDDSLVSPTRFSAVAIDFARRGWAAVVVMRRGYGRSGGSVVENSGPCNDPDYLQAADRSADDVTSVLQALRRVDWVDPDRVLLVGQSTGGMAVLATAARSPPGVVGILNFAGGRGSRGPDDVCRPDLLVAAMGGFGRTTKIPSLWIYAENDHYFGPELARSMFRDYAAHGAPAEFFAAPQNGEDGHGLFLNGIELWREPVEGFLRKLGLPAAYQIDLPTPKVAAPDGLDDKAVEAFRRYIASNQLEKAFAAGTRHGSGYSFGNRTVEEAEDKTIKNCAKYDVGCRVIATGNNLVQ